MVLGLNSPSAGTSGKFRTESNSSLGVFEEGRSTVSFFDERKANPAMECPFCKWQILASWQDLIVATDRKGMALKEPANRISSDYIPLQFKTGESYARQIHVSAWWMQCPNELCLEILLVVGRRAETVASIENMRFKTWYAIPQTPSPRPIDALVSDPFHRDYLEASAILSDSPRMSAVLSRRILADLLEKYAGRNEYNLASRIEKFIDDPKYASHLKDNLHHLREIGDFGAHAQKDLNTGEILDAGPEEAEWTLDVIDSFFDYFIVAPERDRMRRDAWEQKMKDAGRKPIAKRTPKP
jgi:hypothetical protein